ncbi:flippase [Psychrobacillus vulpis]|uniref:Flippase n=1 Tax=Psychrobacillus vulpis TaxID=2325572 RepID=A0A544TUV6_9BACI|nr:flippase [Psychrobacillus vulpis]TQR21226.1 flippase [Psychrobacillus vulpis]
MSNNSSFLKNSIMNFGSNILTIIFGLMVTIIIARSLGVEGQGIFTVITLLPTILVTFMNFGIAPATVFFIGSDRYSMNTIFSTNIILSGVISLFAIVLGTIAVFLFKSTFFDEISISMLLSVLLVLPFLFFNSFLQAVYQGTQNFKRFNAINLSSKFVQVIILLVILSIFKLSLLWALISFIIGSILPTVFIVIYLFKDSVRFKFSEFSVDLTKNSVKYGYKAHLSNIVTFFNYRLDIILISFFLNPVAVGIYNVAVSISERLWIFSQPVASALFPKISSMTDENERNKLTARTAKCVFYLSLFFGIFFWFLSDDVVFILFGINYMEASMVIRILMIGITLFSIEKILSSDISGRGKPQVNLYTSLFTIICNVILSIIFIPKLGIKGAAMATSITYSLTFLIKLIIYIKITKSKLKHILIINIDDIEYIINLITKLIRRMRKI